MRHTDNFSIMLLQFNICVFDLSSVTGGSLCLCPIKREGESPLREPSCVIRCFSDEIVLVSLRAAKKRALSAVRLSRPCLCAEYPQRVVGFSIPRKQQNSTEIDLKHSQGNEKYVP
jgi:hypothetical protein